MDAWREDQLNALLAPGEQEDMFATVARLARGLGFEHCAYGMRAPFALAQGEIEGFSESAEALFDRFAARYASHIHHEERQAYPAALHLLEPALLGRMGQEMAHRRGAPER